MTNDVLPPLVCREEPGCGFATGDDRPCRRESDGTGDRRHGTSILSAALTVPGGKLSRRTMQIYRHQESFASSRPSNGASRRTRVPPMLEIPAHVTPTSRSWLGRKETLRHSDMAKTAERRFPLRRRSSGRHTPLHDQPLSKTRTVHQGDRQESRGPDVGATRLEYSQSAVDLDHLAANE